MRRARTLLALVFLVSACSASPAVTTAGSDPSISTPTTEAASAATTIPADPGATTTQPAATGGNACPPGEGVAWTEDATADLVEVEPGVRMAVYPLPDYEGRLWSQWGQGSSSTTAASSLPSVIMTVQAETPSSTSSIRRAEGSPGWATCFRWPSSRWRGRVRQGPRPDGDRAVRRGVRRHLLGERGAIFATARGVHRRRAAQARPGGQNHRVARGSRTGAWAPFDGGFGGKRAALPGGGRSAHLGAELWTFRGGCHGERRGGNDPRGR